MLPVLHFTDDRPILGFWQQKMPWRPRIDVIKLKRECDRLAFQLLRVREQLRTKERCVTGLEIVLRERLGRIDDLTAQVDRLRHQNRKLDAECEHLAELFRENAA
jgi:septal ring factor EnvC (AmiA/AmiB activator)